MAGDAHVQSCGPSLQSLLIPLVQNSPEVLDHSLGGGDVQTYPQVAVLGTDTQVRLRLLLHHLPVLPTCL